ncbi:CKP2L protein, partial [Serilophus lunatus]|nr:CKP2L protein [Serilophus lunatus]
RRQLEEWLAAKGKTYKRPPMFLLQKQAVIPPCRKPKGNEKQDTPEQCLGKTNYILSECLKLLEEGVHAEELSAVLSLVPQAEKFAKFWICQAKLLAQSGPFDVTGLYRAAVCAGAEPLQELREVVLDILKAAGHTSEGSLNMGGPAGAGAGRKKAEQVVPREPTTPRPGEGHSTASTPAPVGRPLPPSIKLQVTSVSRGKELLAGPGLKFLTPLQLSQWMERAGSHSPEMLRDHDPVVSSLSEILDAEEETQFVFRRNKVLP